MIKENLLVLIAVTESWLWDLIVQALNPICKQIRPSKEPQVRSTPPRTGVQSSEAIKLVKHQWMT